MPSFSTGSTHGGPISGVTGQRGVMTPYRRVACLLFLIPLLMGSGTLTHTAALTAPPSTESVGVWPLVPDPQILERFDPPADPWGSGHRGVDLLGSPGQRVRSAMAGTVTYAGRLAGRGVVSVMHPDGTRTTYQPVTSALQIGDPVPRGGPIGMLELPGSHCFPRACLHWGWLRGDVYLDPLELVGAGPVRLLPLWRDRPITSPS